MRLSKTRAAQIFREEAAAAEGGPIDAAWQAKVQALSIKCPHGEGATHIAFLGISMLARAVDETVDLKAIKPTRSPGNPRAYSARPLCHTVLVPLSTELGVHLGVTGKEPLNNQPYFRIGTIGDGTPINGSARDGFDLTVSLVEELQALTSAESRAALRAFIAVRRTFHPVYALSAGDLTVTPFTLGRCIHALVSEDSENGKRAQAVVAGLFDAVYGPTRVECGRVNDPSRHHPGDVCVRGAADAERWEKAVEVRDKLVNPHDVRVFLAKCLSMGVREAAVVMAAQGQQSMDHAPLMAWALTRGLGLTLFYGWSELTEQVLFWSPEPSPEVVALVVESVEQRLMALEVSAAAYAEWGRLVRGSEPDL